MTNEIKEPLVEKTMKDMLETLSGVEKYVLVEKIVDLQKENERYKKMFEGKERFSKIMPDDMDFIILSKADYDRQQEDIELTAIYLQQRIDKAIDKLQYYNSGEALYYVPIQHIIDILRGDE